MWLRIGAQSIPAAFANQLFYFILGSITGVPFRELTFTLFGFLVFYCYSFALLVSLRT